MNVSTLFIGRPIATTLLTLGVTIAGAAAFFLLPVSPLPQVDFPTISVQGNLPGASPETVATSLATPLERHLGQIADVTEMTSSSAVGQTGITLQFGLDRNIDGAARDVQAAINAAQADLPTGLNGNPTYRKVNPADAPIMILAMTSSTLTQGQVYDSAASVLQQKLSQVDGIGQVIIGGSALPAVRVEVNPYALFKYGIGLEDVRAALAAANANSPKGAIEEAGRHYQLYTNDQARRANQYRDLIIAWRKGAAVRLRDVAEVIDSIENLRNHGIANGRPAVLVIIFRQTGANIIDIIDRVKALLPQLRASIPANIDLTITMDRTTTIRASLHDVETTLLISIMLVVLVVLAFLRDFRAALIPIVAVPVSLIGTFGAMYLLDYSLDNLLLMALIIATGFVVDDAIVVLENVTRHIENGMPRLAAAIQGTREVSFTVLTMSLSLIAVFIPVLLMSGYIGRLFHEFAVTLSVAIAISLVVSLTITPVMCSQLLCHRQAGQRSSLYQLSERCFALILRRYDSSLSTALRHPWWVLLLLIATVCFNIYLFIIVPKGLFPEQDTGRLIGGIMADQNISFQLMQQKLAQFIDIVRADPAVANVVGFTGGGQTNSGRVFVALKPIANRHLSADRVIARLRAKLAKVPGATLFLQSAQDIRVGGRMSNAEYQYTLQADHLADLQTWVPKLTAALQHAHELTDVNSDQQDKGLETDLIIDRNTASRLHLTARQIDNTLNDAFGQRQVSTIYNALNQYHVVMELAPQYWQSPENLKLLFVSTSGGAASGTQATNAVAGTLIVKGATVNTAAIASDSARNSAQNALANTGHGSASAGTAVSTALETMVPLAAFSQYNSGHTPLAINHSGHFASSTISFNLPPKGALSDAVAAINREMLRIGAPITIHGSFQGTAKAFQDSLANQPLLILAALIAVYIVLGMLYESTIHPITILSTLPSAGVGAILALMATDTDFSIIALIGVILLIGIVKKNAILMIDFALDSQRTRGLTTREAIHEACLLRFRPILMTTMVAMLGALPLALGSGDGAELRQPLGIAIVGGLIVSQLLTLYTTPIVYLGIDHLRWIPSRLSKIRRP